MNKIRAKRFEPYRAIGTTHYGFVWIDKGLFRNAEKVEVHGPSKRGPWFFEDGMACPAQIQQVAQRAVQ